MMGAKCMVGLVPGLLSPSKIMYNKLWSGNETRL